MVALKDNAKLPRPEAVLHILLRDGSVTEREITGDEVKIGKGPQNDIILADASVSGAHAMISFDNGVFKLSDLGSRNGTLLNDARVSEPREIHHGDLIKMGHCTLTFRLKEAGDTLNMQRTKMLDGPPPAPPAPPAPKVAALTEDTLAAALVSSGLVARSEVERLRGQDGLGRRLYRALIEEKLATEIGLRDLMSRTFNIPSVELKTMEVDVTAARSLREKFLRERLACPVVTQPEHLGLAVADPTDRAVVEEVERVTRKKVSLRLALAGEIVAALDSFFTPRLVGVMPTGEKIEAVLNQQETEIGKAPHNRVVLSDPTVSSTHAIVLSQAGGFNIVDLGSSNGTFVNGQKLGNESHTLQHGDKIQLGQALLTFRNPAETAENKTARLSLEALEEIRQRAMTRNFLPSAQQNVRTDPASWSAGPIIQSGTDSEEKVDAPEKEKKKKKKKEDDRFKAAMVSGFSRIVAQVIGVLLTVGLTIYVLNREPNGSKHIKPDYSKFKKGSGDGDGPLTPSTKWERLNNGLLGGRLETSGVAFAPGTGGVLMVSDNRGGEVQWMKVNENGQQEGEIKKIPLGVDLVDPEAITYGNSSFYLVGSQSDPNGGGANAIVRFELNSETMTLRGQPEVIGDLRSFLLKNVPEIAGEGQKPGAEGGLNIEGIAWDTVNERLLLGLRSPKIGQQAVIIPIKLRDPRGPFKVENLKVDSPRVIGLSLEDQGVRDITYDLNLSAFLIISGAPETAPKTQFGLWQWNGSDSNPTKIMSLDETMKPEGVTSMKINGRSQVFLVSDTGNYLKLDYTEDK
jgi:pSer/pThr/pTyr-binding forkhead associated (FHA) protein